MLDLLNIGLCVIIERPDSKNEVIPRCSAERKLLLKARQCGFRNFYNTVVIEHCPEYQKVVQLGLRLCITSFSQVDDCPSG